MSAMDALQTGRSEQLREFQARLSERLRQAGTSPRAARLGLELGEQRWLVDLAEAGEIAPVPAVITPVPLTQDWLAGLVNLRGALFAVTDLRRFAGGAPTPLGKEARLLAFGAGLQVNAALLVSRMLGLHDTQGWSAGASRRDPAPWAGRCLVDAQGREWNELSLARLASDERFLCAAR